ncbi:hypothetical protein C8R47DRAFT_1215700 [Mycena vitilis]|nr:hypothetical protein C8R47DRAFT_1215700 [Mycena vitilis]
MAAKRTACIKGRLLPRSPPLSFPLFLPPTRLLTNTKKYQISLFAPCTIVMRETAHQTLQRFGSTSDNPIVMDVDGRLVLGPPRSPSGRLRASFLESGPPSLIRQDIPRIRLRPLPGPVLTPAQARARNQAVSTRRRAIQDENRPVLPPWRAPMRLIPYVEVLSRRAGKRATRKTPLQGEDLYLTDARPGPEGSPHSNLECGICFSIKSHPVLYACGHSHCFVCIHPWLEKSWNCPQCRAKMTARPIRHEDLEKEIAAVHPDWKDSSVVKLSWAGLRFPHPEGTEEDF